MQKPLSSSSTRKSRCSVRSALSAASLLVLVGACGQDSDPDDQNQTTQGGSAGATTSSGGTRADAGSPSAAGRAPATGGLAGRVSTSGAGGQGTAGAAESGGAAGSGANAGAPAQIDPANPIEQGPATAVKLSENNRFLSHASGSPFFWVGDTVWWLLHRLDRAEVEEFLENRRKKGFNVVQFMVVRDLNNTTNAHGDSAFVGGDVTKPLLTEGSDPQNPDQYDFWDHADYVVDTAATKGIQAGIIAVWNSAVGAAAGEKGRIYAQWLSDRYKGRPNVIWLNGGDTDGGMSQDTWKTLGSTFRAADPTRLITFHPKGRMRSAEWYHSEPWLDFNMFQSGHQDYEQDSGGFGPDSYRYVELDYKMVPPKPTLDGEPSYEAIPHGLHDGSKPLWDEDDVRRYAYWSVFAGACGFTYGHNAVMQLYEPGDSGARYSVKDHWRDAMDAPGATQLVHLKKLMLSRPYFERIPDQSLISGTNGVKYEYLIATRGDRYAFVYTYTGRTLPIAMGKIPGTSVKATWYDPRTGAQMDIGPVENQGTREFDPPGEPKEGNDWVLVLDSL